VVDEGAEERLARQLRARRRGARDAAEEACALPRLAERLWVLGLERLERAAVDEGLAHARKVGSRYWEWALLGYGYPFYALGAWDPRGDRAPVQASRGLFQELAVPFHLAVTRLEHGEWLAVEGRAEEAEPLLVEAREVFERLEARRWLDRIARVSAREGVTTPSS